MLLYKMDEIEERVMGRKRLTQFFPGLLPLRKRQKICCYYLGMRLDRNQYAKTYSSLPLPHPMFRASWPLYDFKTGYEMAYQENKAYNCRMAAKKLDGLVIAPGETFSFWNCVRFYKHRCAYKDGFVFSDGRLQLLPGGGLCQMSSFLYWLFLHTPLTIAEQHTHGTDLHLTAPGIPKEADTAVAEGWLDLKVRNDTAHTFQITVSVGGGMLTGAILADASLRPVCQKQVSRMSALC